MFVLLWDSWLCLQRPQSSAHVLDFKPTTTSESSDFCLCVYFLDINAETAALDAHPHPILQLPGLLQILVKAVDCSDPLRVWISSTVAPSGTCACCTVRDALPSLLPSPMRPFLQRTPERQGTQHMEGILQQAKNGMGCWSCTCGLRAEPERCIRERLAWCRQPFQPGWGQTS